MNRKASIGIIGGSGLYNLPQLEKPESVSVETPFGKPSGEYLLGKLGNTEVAFLPRHGRGHVFNPSEVKSIVDAIKQGLVDASAGLFRTETGDLITLADAYEYGYLIRNETIKIAPHTLSLSDSIGQGHLR